MANLTKEEKQAEKAHDHLEEFKVDGGKYYLKGKEVDMDKTSKGHEEIREAIRAYRPGDGEYLFNTESFTFLPAGLRAGTGDSGMAPGHLGRRTVAPNVNSPLLGQQPEEESEE